MWPDKYSNDQSSDEPVKKKANYGGGLVLEPKPGLYEKIVLLLDFNSLYPSIIQEYSLCFTTVDRPKLTLHQIMSKKAEEEEVLPLPAATGEGQLRGVLPKVIRTLVQRRKQVKNQMKNARDEATYKNLDIK